MGTDNEWILRARRETPLQRADRNFQDLLAELRVLQTGVQILFGFLLILAVQPRFAEATPFGRGVYVVTLLLCCAATALLMAPVAVHRAMFAKGRKQEVVRVSNRLALGGMASLFLAIVSAVLLVLDLVFGLVIAIVLATLVAVLFAMLWYVLPVRRLLARRPGPDAEYRPGAGPGGSGTDAR
ncbi:DUF6328 family protein [Actinopolymorpha alba]|uniref:DUF6328 family protein n=1 Tax=Actinopolymorpha alba TaxID=533267 RepID=UPI00036FDFF9|nr:DUF6328 family protein [Actinopolymorpha alba]